MSAARSILVIALALAACSKSRDPDLARARGSSAPAAPAVDPCGVLTVADAEHLLGPGARLEPNGEGGCELRPAERDVMRLGSLAFTIEPAPADWAAFKRGTMAYDKQATQIDGLGDDAFAMLASLVVKKGSTKILVIGTSYLDDQTRQRAVRDLAERLVDRVR